MDRRVVVTGLGLVTPLGVGKAVFAERLFAGESGIGPISFFDAASFDSRLAGQVRDFKPSDHISLKNMRRMDRLSQMATASARMALDDAGLRTQEYQPDRIGIIFGTSFGATDVAAQFGKVLFTEGPKWVNPILVPNTVMNAPAGHAALELGVRGVNATVNHREASSETAIAYAAAQIAKGRADVILAGGGDIISEFYFKVLSRFRTLSPRNGEPEAIRPFDVRRNGIVVGEGAGILCLEALDSASERGAQPYCEVAGWGISAAPAPPNDWPEAGDGAVRAMTGALAAAGICAGDIDYVCAAANGSRRLDRLEAGVLETLFGQADPPPFISALKGALGESFSSGGMRSAAMALSIEQGVLAPILGLADPIAPLNFVRSPRRHVPLNHGMVNGFSSGGTFAVLVLKK
jgi:3-oxoacyl-[acyl-carrier-protein] synthase II